MRLSVVESGRYFWKLKLVSGSGVVHQFVCAVAIAAWFAVSAAGEGRGSPLALKTSNPRLQQSFDWAKQQALAYVSSGDDAVKDWYEAALPGRHAFCMRDVSHQVAGAAALGLAIQNKSMLTRFAKGISASKDWASYWEIDRDDKPSPADYVSDEDFWYNLPANFDVMDAALRIYMWTGDGGYIADPVFANFYQHTMTNYIQRWQLGRRTVLSRPRIMNQHLAAGKFVRSRGIPGYTEERTDFNVGSDLLAAEYRAMRSYAGLLRMQGKGGDAAFDAEAEAVGKVLEQHAWDQQGRHFYNGMQMHGPGVGSGDTLILYFQAAMNPRQRAQAIEEMKKRTHEAPPGIEEQSYRPEVLFRMNAPDEAYGQILDLSRLDRDRREYPEVSYAIIGSIVNGMMGVNVVPKNSQAPDRTPANDVVVQTLPRLPQGTEDVEIEQLPVRSNMIAVKHLRNHSSTLHNETGPSFTWRASFDGSLPYLVVNGKKVQATKEMSVVNTPISFVDVEVSPGMTVTVTQ